MSESFDPSAYGVTGASAAAAFAAWKVVGPSLKKTGVAIGDWTDYRLRNLLGIGEKASAKLGDASDQPGGVHPRVAHKILEEGSWCDDDVVQEYLAGLLAGARTPDADDDRAAYFVDLIAALSANQVRLNYALYSALIGQRKPGLSLKDTSHTVHYFVTAPVESFEGILSIRRGETLFDTVAQTWVLLRREGLVGHGGVGLAKLQVEVPSIHSEPTTIGAQLFLAAHGQSAIDADRLLGDPHLPPFDPPPPALIGAEITEYLAG